MNEIDVNELKAKIDRQEEHQLLDVREAMEREICTLENDIHIPMNQIPGRFNELDSEKQTVVYCRSGARSAQVAQFLSQKGFKDVKNLAGGILAWSDEIDPDMPKY